MLEKKKTNKKTKKKTRGTRYYYYYYYSAVCSLYITKRELFLVLLVPIGHGHEEEKEVS